MDIEDMIGQHIVVDAGWEEMDGLLVDFFPETGQLVLNVDGERWSVYEYQCSDIYPMS